MAKHQKRKHQNVRDIHTQIPDSQYKALNWVASRRGCSTTKLHIEAIQRFLNTLPSGLRDQLWQALAQQVEGKSQTLPLANVTQHTNNNKHFPWMPIYAHNILHGSTALMPDFAFNVWIKLLLFAWDQRCYDGLLRISPTEPMPDRYIVEGIKVTLSQFHKAIEIFEQDINRDDGLPRVQRLEDGTLVLTNWAKHHKLKHEPTKPSDESIHPKTVTEQAYRDVANLYRLGRLYPNHLEKIMERNKEDEARFNEYQERMDKLYRKRKAKRKKGQEGKDTA